MFEKFERGQNTPAKENNAPEKIGSNEGIEAVIAEAKSITAELEAHKVNAENRHEVVVDMETYRHIKKQQGKLRELFMNNVELTKDVCGEEEIYYDPRLDAIRQQKMETENREVQVAN